MYFKPPSYLRDNFMLYFEVNLHFLNNQLMCSYLYKVEPLALTLTL